MYAFFSEFLLIEQLYPAEETDEVGVDVGRMKTSRTKKYDHKDVSVKSRRALFLVSIKYCSLPLID